MNREERERCGAALKMLARQEVRPKGWDWDLISSPFFGVDRGAGSNYYTLVMTAPAWNGTLMNWGDAPSPNHE